jgi:hypothetical protein
MSYSAKEILKVNDRPGTKVSVEHVRRNGAVLERFSSDSDFIDGRGQKLHCHDILTADPVTERPLAWQIDITGMPQSLQTWEYPADDPRLLELPMTQKTRLYDLDEQHKSVMTALRSRGPTVTVAGERVELLQIWVDENGHVGVIARASYAYPINYGLKIDGFPMDSVPGGEPRWGLYDDRFPTLASGHSVQLFYDPRDQLAVPHALADVISVELPVFAGKKFAGFARFENVHVNRTLSVHTLLEPFNVPYWVQPTQNPAPTHANP